VVKPGQNSFLNMETYQNRYFRNEWEYRTFSTGKVFKRDAQGNVKKVNSFGLENLWVKEVFYRVYYSPSPMLHKEA